MHIRQYTTDQSHTLWEIPAGPAPTLLPGVVTLEIGLSPLPHPVNGFGAAVTASSCCNLSLMTQDERAKLLSDLYGPEGLNMNAARLTIGSSDYSPEAYTYADTPDDPGMVYFSMARDEKYVLPVQKEIVSFRSDLFLFASPWSPPAWMKTGGRIAGGCMRDKYLDAYVRYFIKYLTAMRERGISIHAVSPQNEPETDTRGHYPGCFWHPETEAAFIHRLRAALDKAGLDTRIWMYDHNYDGWQRVKWMLEEDPDLLDDIDAVAFHYYSECPEMTDALTDEWPDLKLAFTEGGPRINDNYGTDHCKWARIMARAFRHGCRTFIGWNLILDETGGPTIGPFFCGGLVTRDSLTGEITRSGQYRAMSHFSRFVRRGDQVLPVRTVNDGLRFFAYPDTGAPLDACAFRGPDGHKVIVLVNPSSKERKQVQIMTDGQPVLVNLLPDSVSTVVIG